MLWLYVTIFLLKIKRLHTFFDFFFDPSKASLRDNVSIEKVPETFGLVNTSVDHPKKHTFFFFPLKDMKVLKKNHLTLELHVAMWTLVVNSSFWQLFRRHSHLTNTSEGGIFPVPGANLSNKRSNEEQKKNPSIRGYYTLPTQTMNPISGEIL